MTQIRYSKDIDALLFELSQEKIDYAEEAGPVIVHFSAKGEPVLLEILNARDFLNSASSLVTGPAKFELYKDIKGEFRWKLVASDGQTIASSGDGYTTLASAKAGIESFKKNAPVADIKEA